MEDQGQTSSAIKYYERSLKINPNTNEEKYLVEFSSRFNSTLRREERAPQPMINAEFGVNMPKRHLQHAKPNHLTYIKINLPKSFLIWYQILSIMPKRPVVLMKLWDACSKLGDAAKAIKHYTSASEVTPESPTAMNGLAWTRATHSDEALAVVLAERCCWITQNRMVPALNALAAAYAEVG